MAEKFYLATFGCRVNQADSAAMKKQLEDEGFRQSEDVSDCSVIIVNSCTVTHRSDQQVRQLTRKLRRENPTARLIVTGCYAQRDPKMLAEMDEVDLVLGNLEKEQICDFLNGSTGQQVQESAGQQVQESAGQQVSRSTGQEVIGYRSSVTAHQSSVVNAECGMGNAEFPIADCGLQIADCGLQIADCGLQIADCGLQIADCPADHAIRNPQLENPQSNIPHSAFSIPHSAFGKSAIRNPQSEIPHSAFGPFPIPHSPNPQSAIRNPQLEKSAIRNPQSPLPLPIPSYFDNSKVFVSDLSRETEIEVQPVTTLEGKTRPFVKIQEGCDSRCSYCIVPFVRGAGRSVPPDSVLLQVRQLLDEGYKEIVLTGIHLGSYGSKLKPRVKLEELVCRLLDVCELHQLRLSSIEPMRFSRKLIDLAVGDARFAPHFHLPLQSGSDFILGAMNRTYGREQYADLIAEIHQRLPHASIGTDVMVGFPGETEESFEETRRFIEELPLAYLHVFPFSRRTGTVAAEMENQVNESDKSSRVEILRRLSAQKLRAFEDRFLGSVLRALVLHEREAGYWTGLTGNYLKVKIPVEQSGPNEFIFVTLQRRGDLLYGFP